MSSEQERTEDGAAGGAISKLLNSVAFSALVMTALFLPLVFSPFPSGSYRVPRMLALEASALLISVLLSVSLFFGRAPAIRKTPLNIFVALLPFVAAVSSAAVVQRGGSVVMLPVHVALAAMYFIALVLIDTREKAASIIDAIALGAGVSAVIAILEVHNIEFWTWQVNWGERVDGPFDDPNFLGGYLAMATPLICARLLTKTNPQTKISLLALLGLVMTGLFYSYSRSGWIVFLFGVALFLALAAIRLRERGRREVIYTAAALVITALVIFGVTKAVPSANPSKISVARRVDTAESFAKTQGASKLALWKIAAAMMLDRPLAGAGPGNFSVYHPLYRSKTSSAAPDSGMTYDVYNDYLELGAEMGVIALAVFLIVSALFVSVSIKSIFFPGAPPEGLPLLIGVLCCGAVFLANCAMFQFPMKNLPQFFCFFLMCAIAAGERGRGHAREEEKYSVIKAIAPLLAVALVIAWAPYANRLMRCNSLFQEVAELYDAGRTSSAFDAAMLQINECPAHRNEKMYVFAGEYLLNLDKTQDAAKVFKRGLAEYPYNYYLLRGAVKCADKSGDAKRGDTLRRELKELYRTTK